MSGRTSACAGRTPRRRTAGNRGSPPSVRTAPRPRGRACASGSPAPPSAASAAAAGRPCPSRPSRTAPRGSANPSPGQFRQRVIDVDDLVEPRPEEIVLPTVPPFVRPHRITLRQATEGQNHDQTFRSICKKSSRPLSLSCKCKHLTIRANGSKIRRFGFFTGD